MQGFCGGDRDHFDLSGPVLSQNMEDLLQRNENHIRQAARRSRVDHPKGMYVSWYHSILILYFSLVK